MGRRPSQPLRTKAPPAPKTKKTKAEPLPSAVQEMEFNRLPFALVGVSPLLYHRPSEKVWQELTLPKVKTRTRSGLELLLRHEPMVEFRDSIYRSKNPRNPTLLQFQAAGFRRAMSDVALDMPGWTKAGVARLIWCRGIPYSAKDQTALIEAQMYVNVYGVPMIHAGMVRNLGINRTRDVRYKAILPMWCAEVLVNFTRPNLTRQGILTLLQNAGMLRGVGDGRQEKGILSLGQFRPCNPDDPEFLAIKQAGGRAAQIAAMEKPEAYDEMTERLIEWFPREVERRRAEGTLSELTEIDEDAMAEAMDDEE